MAIERWGSLSVKDHINTGDLITNVLLYDRLVLPVFTPDVDRDEHEYWTTAGWHPKLQLARVAQLGDLAVRRPWDKSTRALYSSRLAALRAEKDDKIDYFGITQELISSKSSLIEVKFPGVTAATTIAAYNSASAMGKDFEVRRTEDHLANQAYLIGRRVVLPDIDDHEEALKCAIALSHDDSFRAKRARFFDWQAHVADPAGLTAAEVVDEIQLMTADYNNAVQDAYDKVAMKSVFSFFGIGLTIVGAGASLLIPAAGVALAVVQFLAMDAKPVVDAGNADVVAMFHDIKKKVTLA